MRERFSRQVVEKELRDIISEERLVGMYAPLFKRVTIYEDDDIPEAVHKTMRDKNHAPMAADSDGMKLFIDREFLWESINVVAEAYDRQVVKNPDGYFMPNLHNEIKNILVHELTHILCQHSQRGIRRFAKYMQNGENKVPRREYMAWMAACEVEANRGYGIRGGGSPIYWCGVTDTYTYPKAKGCRYLEDIYQCILKEYGEELEKDFDDVKELVEKKLGRKGGKKSGGSEGDKEGNEKGTNGGKANGKEGTQSGNESSGSQGGKQDGNSSSQSGEGSSHGEGNGSSQPSSDGQGQRDAKAERIEKLAEMLLDPSSQMTERQFDPDLEGMPKVPREKIYSKSGEKGHAFGLDQGSQTVVDISEHDEPDSILRKWEADYNAQVIAKSLEKMKSDIVGKIARERVDTYARQARRDTSDGLLKKGTKRATRSTPKILVALDKSGSMSSTTTAQATEAIAKIFDTTGRPTQGCYICLHDGEAHEHKPFKQWKEVVTHFYPSGGNDFVDVMRLANKLNVDVVLNVGDGGDYFGRSGSAHVKEFVKAGRRWIDVNIANESRRYSGDYIRDVYPRDYAEHRLMREWVDMTGNFEITKDDVLELVKSKHLHVKQH